MEEIKITTNFEYEISKSVADEIAIQLNNNYVPVCLTDDTDDLNENPITQVDRIIGEIIKGSARVNENNAITYKITLLDSNPLTNILKELINADLEVRYSLVFLGDFDSDNSVSDSSLIKVIRVNCYGARKSRK